MVEAARVKPAAAARASTATRSDNRLRILSHLTFAYYKYAGTDVTRIHAACA